jgi:hypothetical protein
MTDHDLKTLKLIVAYYAMNDIIIYQAQDSGSFHESEQTKAARKVLNLAVKDYITRKDHKRIDRYIRLKRRKIPMFLAQCRKVGIK